MIEYIEGNIFRAEVQTLVNPINTVGVMGAGLAKKFAQMYPNMYIIYKEISHAKQLRIGKLWLYEATDVDWVLNFPTKRDWRQPSMLGYIESGLIAFVNIYKAWGITSIAFPQLGCGNGELKWKDVKPLMENYLNDLEIPIEIYIFD